MDNKNLLSELHIDAASREGGGFPKHWRKPAAAVALLLLVLAGFYFMLGGKTIEVETATAEPPPSAANAAAVLDATGYVTARLQATVASKITGMLKEVLIEEGETVQRGQIMARLDDSDAQAQLGLAQAHVAAAVAQIGQIEAALVQAKRDQKRQKELRARNVSPAKLLDDANTQVTSVSAQLQAQKRQIGVARAELRVAQVAYDNTIVRAPFSGIIVAKSAQPGEIVSPISAGGGFTRTGIGTIVDMQSLEIEVDINESFINRVAPRQPVIAVLDAYPDWKIPAEVINIIPTADRAKATVKVRIKLKVRDSRIVPDMGVRVSFYEETKDKISAPRGVLIPANALLERDGHNIVFRLDGDVAKIREVKAGQAYSDLRLIESGLALGDRVVLNPPTDMPDGARVKQKSVGN